MRQSPLDLDTQGDGHRPVKRWELGDIFRERHRAQ